MFEIVLLKFLYSVLNRKVRKKLLLTSELRTLVDVKEEEMKLNATQKFETSFDLDQFSG